MKFLNTFEYHRRKPEKSLEVYTKEVRLQLGREIKELKKIYLDTNYWLNLRNVVLGREKNVKLTKLLSLLRQGVRSGKLICPIGEEIFYEILKQSDPSSLNASVDLIDELSKGISILSTKERIQFEILYFIHSTTKGKDSIYHPDIFVWTKLAYILGAIYPTSTPFSQEDELVIQKVFFDQMWASSLSDVIEVMGMEAITNMPTFKDISDKLNEGKIQYVNENKSFKQIYLSEFAGTLDLYLPLFEDVFIYLFKKEKRAKPINDEFQSASSGKQLANLIYHAFKKNKLGGYFPTLIIGAGLHASVRLDIHRKFEANDMSDFRHAQTALPYFDYFFTERSLRDLVTRKNVAFDKKYNCGVYSLLEEIIDCVNKICS